MIKKSLLILILLVIFFFVFFSVNRVSGSDNSLITNDSYIIAEKISYLFEPPQKGDFVLFQNNQSTGVDFVGQIFDVTEEGNVRKYHVSAKKDPVNPWIITRDKISAKIIFPRL